MNVADAWATETTTITSAKRADRARLAAEREAWEAQGNRIKLYGPTGRQIEYDWRDFTLGGRDELERKRKKGGKKAQRVIELDRLKG